MTRYVVAAAVLGVFAVVGMVTAAAIATLTGPDGGEGLVAALFVTPLFMVVGALVGTLVGAFFAAKAFRAIRLEDHEVLGGPPEAPLEPED